VVLLTPNLSTEQALISSATPDSSPARAGCPIHSRTLRMSGCCVVLRVPHPFAHSAKGWDSTCAAGSQPQSGARIKPTAQAVGGMDNQHSRSAAKEVRGKQCRLTKQRRLYPPRNIPCHLSFRTRFRGEEPALSSVITKRVGRTLLSTNVRTTTSVRAITPNLVILRKWNLRNAKADEARGSHFCAFSVCLPVRQ
jgi:hypothetical protein